MAPFDLELKFQVEWRYVQLPVRNIYYRNAEQKRPTKSKASKSMKQSSNEMQVHTPAGVARVACVSFVFCVIVLRRVCLCLCFIVRLEWLCRVCS